MLKKIASLLQFEEDSFATVFFINKCKTVYINTHPGSLCNLHNFSINFAILSFKLFITLSRSAACSF